MSFWGLLAGIILLIVTAGTWHTVGLVLTIVFGALFVVELLVLLVVGTTVAVAGRNLNRKRLR